MEDTGDLPGRLRSGLKCSFMDFMTHTSSHGAKYVCEDGRRTVERVFWVGMIGIGIGVSTFMVMNIYGRYASNPTVTTLEQTHYPTWRIPFPAITLCNNNRILQSKAEEFVENLSIPDHLNASQVLDALRLVLKDRVDSNDDHDIFRIMQDVLDFNSLSIEKVMLELSQPCNKMLERCSWQNEIVKCSDLFEMRKTYLGFCCSFNYVGVKDSNSDSNSTLFQEPIQSRLYGHRMGLAVLVNPEVDDYFLSSFSSSGITVLIHNPDTYPDSTVISKAVPVKSEAFIPIRFMSILGTDDVRAMSTDERECLFSDESNLNAFPLYTYLNCITECKMNNSIQLCSCAPYFYPADEENHRVCDLIDSECLYDNVERLTSFKPGLDSERISIIDDHETNLRLTEVLGNAMECDCPNQCDFVNYETRISLGDFKASSYSVNNLFGPDTNDTNRILLHVFSETNISQQRKKDVATTTSALLSMLGGVCGLFLGSSFVTLLEMAYFFIYRLPGFVKHGVGEDRGCPVTPHKLRENDKNKVTVIKVLPRIDESSEAYYP